MDKEKQGCGQNHWILFAVGILIVTNVLIDIYFYHNYQEKLNILAGMIQSEETGIDRAFTILRSEHFTSTEGLKALNQYGYLSVRQNTFGRQFQKECMITGVITSIAFILFLLYQILQNKRIEKKKKDWLEELERILIAFREDELEPIWLEGEQENIQHVNHQIEALQYYLRWIRERAVSEKEETKSVVTDISHQLKTPVAALDTCFTILEDKDISEKERVEFTKRCRNELNSLEILLQSLLQISRLETGIIRIELEKRSLLETLIEAVNRIYPKTIEKEIEIGFDYEKEIEHLEMMQDKKWLCEAFVNLLDNAIKYSKVKSEIKIGIYKRSTFVRIEVVDQGIGVPKEEYHKIFQRFYRGTLKCVKEASGSGVGLYLVRQIVEQHHGSVSVSSEYGRSAEEYPGSTFVVQIPFEM